jgi:hypothetical protein
MTNSEMVRAETPPAKPRAWELGWLDKANLILTLRGTWIFDAHLDTEAMRRSLSRLLGLLPHLSGRMRNGSAVDLCNAGVPFQHIRRPDMTLGWACAHPEHASIFSAPLSHWRVKRGKEAPMSVTITHLGDGSVLGVRCSHACLDGQGFYGMVRLWSQLHRGEPFTPPILDQSLAPTPSDRPKAEVIRLAREAGWSKISPLVLLSVLPRYLLGRLHRRAPGIHFSKETIGRLRKEAAAAPADTDCHERHGADGLPSVNVALTAHLTRMCNRLFGLPDGTPCSQVTVLDGRERLPSVPAGFAGNAAFAVSTARYPSGAHLSDLAAQIERRLSVFTARPSPALLEQVSLGVDLMSHKVLMAPYDLGAMHRSRPTLTYVNNFTRLPIYDVDFGDLDRPARPVRVIPHDLPDPVLLWPAPPEVGGVEAYLTGVEALAAMKLPPDDPWWRELRIED